MEHAVEALDGSTVAGVDGIFGEAEHGCRFGKTELFQMAQDDDLTVDTWKLRDCTLQSGADFGLNEVFAWRCGRRHEAIDKQRVGFIGQVEVVGFAVYGAPLGIDMTTVQIDKRFPGNLPQPRVEGDTSIVGIGAQLFVSFD